MCSSDLGDTLAGSSATAVATSLASGATLTLVVNATVTATTGNVTNTAAGTSTTPDPVPSNNAATVTVTVAASADLQVTKVASSANGTAGSTISYTVTLVNLGPSAAQNVTLTDVLSAGLTLGAVSSTGGKIGRASCRERV